MNLNPVARFKSAQAQPTISVEDVERVRRQRRLAKTEEECSDVRSQMRDLVAELRPGLGELDCIGPEQMEALADAGVVNNADATRVLAVIDKDLSGAFDRVMAESARGVDVAEFGERVDFALLDPSTGAVTTLYGIDGLKDGAQVSAAAVSMKDPTTMWITLEGDNRIHKVELD